MGARAQVITYIRIKESQFNPFFIVHRQWAEGTSLLLEILDIMSFVFSERPNYFHKEFFRDEFKRKITRKFYLLPDYFLGTDESVKRFYDGMEWKKFDNDLGYAVLEINMNRDGSFTGQLDLKDCDFKPITINQWRERFQYYDSRDDSEAFYSGFSSLMQWYEISVQ